MKKYIIALSVIFCASSAFAQFSESQFEEILRGAQKRVSPTNYEMTTFTGFKPIKYMRKTGDRKWEIGLNSWGPNNTTSTQDLLSTVAIVTLDGDGMRYEYISATQAVDADIVDQVKDYKYVKVAQKWLDKQMNLAVVTYKWTDGRYVTQASSTLDGKEKKIGEDLTNLLNVSRGMQNTIAIGANKVK
ncbi:MAG: hypothetical protein KI790_08710 [Cyclobacteriaceae bacterium]|nr:hypothetical protein [Cyclobacteriaceae bacterium HetDA_MAG_MS6]